MDICAIVVIACCFTEQNRLCQTTIARLRAVLELIPPPGAEWEERPRRLLFVVTGDVPYQPGGKTLGELMREYLLAAGIAPATVLMAAGATGSFAEPRLVTGMLEKLTPNHSTLNLVVVVSSDWQLWVGRPFWEHSAEEARFLLNFLPVLNTGGWRTRIFYAAFASAVRIALMTGLWPSLEPWLYKRMYAPRYTRGFRMKGCA